MLSGWCPPRWHRRWCKGRCRGLLVVMSSLRKTTWTGCDRLAWSLCLLNGLLGEDRCRYYVLARRGKKSTAPGDQEEGDARPGARLEMLWLERVSGVAASREEHGSKVVGGPMVVVGSLRCSSRHTDGWSWSTFHVCSGAFSTSSRAGAGAGAALCCRSRPEQKVWRKGVTG